MKKYKGNNFAGLFIRYIPILVALPGLSDIFTFLRLGLTLVVLIFIFNNNITKKDLKLLLPIFLYYLILMINLFFSLNLKTSINYFIERLSFLAVILLTLDYVRSYEEIIKIFRTWLAISIIAAMFGIVEMVTNFNPLISWKIIQPDSIYFTDISRSGFSRSVGIYSQPILFAFQILVTLPFLIFRSKPKIGPMSILMLGCLASGTRGALIIFTFLMFFYIKEYISFKIKQFVLISVLVILTIFIFDNFYTYIYNSIKDVIMLPENQASNSSGANLLMRINMLSNGIDFIKKNDLWMGLGAGVAFQARETVLYGYGNFGSFENTFFFVFLESGLLGLISFTMMVVYYLWKSWKIGDYYHKNLNINKIIFYSMMICILMSLDAAIINFGHAFYVYGVIVGMSLSVYKLNENAKKNINNNI